jgi:site-specific DNA-methyltransferase (adenine-specific)
LKQGGVLVWIVGDSVVKGTETATSFKQALFFKEQCGLNLHDTMIWEKNGFSFPANNRYHQVFEYMFIFSKGKPKTFHPIIDRQNKYAGSKITGTDRLKDGSTRQCSGHKKGKAIAEMGKRYNVWKINTEHSVTWHPAPFPLKLAEDHIQTWTNPGDLVLDPLMGSGTTGLASKILNRHFIGIEINKNYFLEAHKRITSTAYQGCNFENSK